jgi:hypothetical protein
VAKAALDGGHPQRGQTQTVVSSTLAVLRN